MVASSERRRSSPGGFRARRAWRKTAWEQERDRERASKAAERARRAAELTEELAAQSERAVSEVCTHPPGLLRDEPIAEHSVAPTAGDSPLLAGGDSLLSERSSLAPRPRGARAQSIARDVDAKSLVDMVADFYVKATGKDGVQMRRSRPRCSNVESGGKSEQRRCSASRTKRRRHGPLQKKRRFER